MGNTVVSNDPDDANLVHLKCLVCDDVKRLILPVDVKDFAEETRLYENAHHHPEFCWKCKKSLDRFSAWELDLKERIWCHSCRMDLLSAQT